MLNYLSDSARRNRSDVVKELQGRVAAIPAQTYLDDDPTRGASWEEWE